MSLDFVNWEKVKLVSAGVAAGAFVLAGVGFGWGGWVLPSKAEEMAQTAVIERLVPICVAQFLEDPQRKEKLVALEEADYMEQTSYLEKQGWATMPGAEEPNPAVAERCVREIRYVNP